MKPVWMLVSVFARGGGSVVRSSGTRANKCAEDMSYRHCRPRKLFYLTLEGPHSLNVSQGVLSRSGWSVMRSVTMSTTVQKGRDGEEEGKGGGEKDWRKRVRGVSKYYS